MYELKNFKIVIVEWYLVPKMLILNLLITNMLCMKAKCLFDSKNCIETIQ